MARFYSYEEIALRTPTPMEDIQWLAGEIATLEPFVEGTAVLCGSVSWGKHSWRSDIDIAHFSTITHPQIDRAIEDIVQQYVTRTNNQFIAPRADVITIGAESMAQVSKHRSISTSLPPTHAPKKGPVTDVFVETSLRFADHIGAIASLKGDPWRTFLDRYLSTVDRNREGRREITKQYVERMTTQWAQRPLHRLNFDRDGRFTAKQLDLLGKSENYPINLMRRILGDLGRYPSPDRASDVRASFSALEEPWSKDLLAQFDPFFSLSERYEEIVAACRVPQSPLEQTGYYEQVRSLFVDLPFAEIQNSFWKYSGV
jgi:hypothetical protein